MNVLILVEDQYEDQEAWYPFLRLREAGHNPIVVGKEKREYKSKHGYPIKATKTFKECSARSAAGVIIPGGYAPDKLRMHADALKLVKQCDNADKVVAAICHGSWVPVSAGIVANRAMTCYKAIKDDVINAGAKYVDKEVVVDRNLITSRTPLDLPAFMREVLKQL